MAERRKKRRTGFLRTPRYVVEYIGFRLFELLMRILPIDQGSAFIGWTWRHIAPFLHRHPRVIAHLTRAFPQMPEKEREAIARDMWEGLGRVFAESFMIDRIVAAGRIRTEAGPLLDELKQAGRGIVFVSLHTGNFELVIVPTLEAGIKCAGVYQRIRNPYVDRRAVALRRSRYPRGLFARQPNVARLLMRIVRDGGSVATLADLRDRRGILVPFFGHPAPTNPFPAYLSRTTGAPLVIARTVRLNGVNFRIDAEVLPVPVTADREADVAAATAAIQARFETWIREHPEQWMWAHRRWG